MFLAGERWLAPGEPAEISDLFLLSLCFHPLQFEPIERLEELGVNKRKQANNNLFLAPPRENFPTTLCPFLFLLAVDIKKAREAGFYTVDKLVMEPKKVSFFYLLFPTASTFFLLFLLERSKLFSHPAQKLSFFLSLFCCRFFATSKVLVRLK